MATEQEIKQAVVDLARKQANNGAHYLWGGAGNTPGQADGPSFRPNHVLLHPNVPDVDTGAAAGGSKRTIPNVPTLFAAWVDSNDQGKLACAGRCAIKSVQDLDLALQITVKDALELKLKTMTSAQIDEFKQSRKDAVHRRWPRPNGNLDASGFHSTVWGQCCVGVRHFDCIGLVNYCYTIVLGKPWQYGIESFTTGGAGFPELKSLSDVKTGDIVTIGTEHIGIVSDKNTAIEAKDPGDGVVERPLSAAGWTQFWRVPPSSWK